MNTTNLKNERLSDKEFKVLHEEAMAMWPTSKEIDFNEAVEFRAKLNDEQNGVKKLVNAKGKGEILLEPRGGVATIEEQIELSNYLLEVGKADIIPTTFDSYTRTQRFKEAQLGIEESLKRGRSMLNGLPVVNLGVRNCRKIVESVNAPINARTGVTDGRLSAETVFAAGFAGFQGSAISHNIAYTKNVPLEITIKAWQYIDRLIAKYGEQGVDIFREDFSPLTGTLIPPCISIAISIIDLLMSVEQGVKYFLQGYGQGGGLFQDIAALKVMPKLAVHYLNKLGYSGKKINIFSVFHQWMGAFPTDEAQAFGVISYASMVGALGGANVIITKSPQEALGIPTKEANAQGLKATRQVIQMIDAQRMPSNKKLEQESTLIEKETKSIVDKVLEIGEGDIVIGTIKGFQLGILDVPWAPHILNANKVLPVRDYEGDIRFLDTGNLPFPEDIKKFHKERVNMRAKAENREANYEMLIEDIYAIGRGMLKGKPLY
jgi:methylaspartate mutase epsilon subunit